LERNRSALRREKEGEEELGAGEKEILLAFSCKGRGFRPASDPKLLGKVRKIFLRALMSWSKGRVADVNYLCALTTTTPVHPMA